MFSRLRIQNFKGWRDTKAIRLAPLTVFFGSNSSGKSSLLQFLLMLKQTAESPDRRRLLHPGDRSTLVELGTYRDVITDHDFTRRLQFEMGWTLPHPLVVEDPLHPAPPLKGDEIRFEATIASDPKGTEQWVDSMLYELVQPVHALNVLMRRKDQAKYMLESQNYTLVRTPGRPWPLPAPLRFYGFPNEVAAYYQNAQFTSDLALEMEKQLRRIQYLGPLRGYPERSYVWSGEVPEHVGWRGERAVEAMLAASNRTINRERKARKRPFQEVVASWLQRLGLLQRFQVKPIAPHRKEYEVLVRTLGSDVDVPLPDVGFGVSQVLPVIVQCFYAAPHSTVLLEQPEIHLHPKVQTELADLFIEAVKCREDGRDRSIQLIVESHSEHFLRRLQRRIAEDEIAPDDVALYFAENGPQGPTLRALDLNLYGEIQNWPEDFFGDEMAEMAGRMDAAAKKEIPAQ